MDCLEVIKSRRSVRKFKDTPVPRQIIDDLIESARLAPSGGNGQGWLFGLITEKSVIRQLARAAGNQGWIATAPLVIALCAKLERKLNELSEDDFSLIVDKERFTPELISYLQGYPDQKSVSLLFANAVPMIPGEHIFLTAVNYGLSACWVGYLNVKKASEILNLPEDFACLFLLPIGFKDAEPKQVTRKAVSEITFLNRY